MSSVLPPALDALAAHTRWLEERLASGRRDGFREPRLGTELFSRKLRLVLDTELPVEQILARAEADLARMTEELAAAAAGLMAAQGGTARDEAGLVRAALDSLAADAPDDATILGFVRAAYGVQREFVVTHDLVTVFDDQVEVIPMPEIDRGVAVAYCDSPGPLETAALPTFIARVTDAGRLDARSGSGRSTASTTGT